MEKKEVDQRKVRCIELAREYRASTNDTKKAIRDWAEALTHANALWADGFLQVLKDPHDDLGEARNDAAHAQAKVARMEAEAKMKTVMEAEKAKRKELEEALDGFGRAAEREGIL